ncbi:class I SAM-dependent methyltransferase [Flavobacteriaceae bacterium]|nr:class I SAM-dependent methyltransferase [Flavobacteriaceae bacterium]
MNKNIFDKNVQDYISKNLSADVFEIILKKQIFPKVSNKEIAEQISAKAKSKKKLPTYFNTPNIYFPNKVNIEQTSSEKTAEFKSKIVAGNSMIDATGGFGVDSMYFSKEFKKTVYIEKNKELFEIVKANSKELGLNNIEHLNEDGIEYAKKLDTVIDLLYIDPSRRNKENKKVHLLSDCTPLIDYDLIESLQNFKTILIKCSPIIDLKKTINDLKVVSKIYIVGINNEVKEVLFSLNNQSNNDIKIKCIELSNRELDFEFNINDIDNKKNDDNSEVLNYLYEPNSMILKSGAFSLICDRYDVKKLSSNSHLYTSKKLIDFPGRVFEVKSVVNYSKKNLKDLNISKANITTRNFPIDVKDIRKKSKILDGGDNYLFFTTNHLNDQIIIKTKKPH